MNGPSPLVKIDAAGALGVAAIIAAVVFLAAAPAITENRARAKREAALLEIREETDHAVAVLRDTRTRLRESRQRAEDLPDHLRESHDLNERIARIVEETESHGLSVQTIVPGEPVTTDRYTRTPIELSTRAPVEAIARYLHELHGSSPDLELTNLQIRKAGESDDLDATIRAEWITLAD